MEFDHRVYCVTHNHHVKSICVDNECDNKLLCEKCMFTGTHNNMNFIEFF